jgi:3-methyladenine DNA glycosylase AlkD
MTSTIHALPPHAAATRAAGAFAYMKGIAPFLGVPAPDRRKALRGAWAHLDYPTSDELGEAALELMVLPEREYHYAAYDLIDRYRTAADESFLRTYAAELLTTTPWWDTVDGLVSAMVSPLMKIWHDDALIDEWSSSGDRWLVRSAIGHQRGWKRDTDIDRVLHLCDAHWSEREFFIAKAIGWAMRDLARIEPHAVNEFLIEHSTDNRVAIREAQRGLQSTASAK